MRSDLEHLPDKKRRDLDRIVEVLFAEFEQATSLSTQKWRRQGRIVKVILYGSYARGDWVDDPIGGYQSDYDILVVVSDERLTEPSEFWAKADDQFVREVTISKRISAPVTFIVHSLADVNNQLTQGRPFFIDAIEQGIALYEVEDYPFVTPQPLEPKAALAEARKHFDQWFPSASEFLELGKIAAENGMLNKGAFLFHQAADELAVIARRQPPDCSNTHATMQSIELRVNGARSDSHDTTRERGLIVDAPRCGGRILPRIPPYTPRCTVVDRSHVVSTRHGAFTTLPDHPGTTVARAQWYELNTNSTESR